MLACCYEWLQASVLSELKAQKQHQIHNIQLPAKFQYQTKKKKKNYKKASCTSADMIEF